MNLALVVLAVTLFVVLVMTTLVQTYYLELLRIKARDPRALQFFKDNLDERIGVKADKGALAFSLIKHLSLGVLGVVIGGLFARGNQSPWKLVLEGTGVAAAATIAGAYLVPQFLYRRAGARWLVPFVPLLRLMEFSTRPFTVLVSFLDSLADLGSGGEAVQENGKSEEPIDALIDAGTEEGIIEEHDRKLIQSVVAFGDKTVREVMTPRPRIVAIDVSRSLEDVRRLVIHEQYSRVPVFDGSIDNMVGFVHVRDMFELDAVRQGSTVLRQLVRQIDFVPESKPASMLLREMQEKGAHMAVVIDEYGNTAGLVTLEDLVEEILGEIRDEHEPSADVTREADGAIVVAGSYDVDGLRDLVGFRPDDETQSTTVAGLVTEWLGRVPRPGETVDRDGIHIEVLASNELRVDRVRISTSVREPELTREEAADG